MKRVIVFLTISILSISCGTEEMATQYVAGDNLVSNTMLRGKIMRVAQHPTAVDDFIDGCSCFSVKMPYTLFVNDNEILVADEGDYQQVYDILHASDYDYDMVEFASSPLTVIYPDYHEEELDLLQYMAAVEACTATAPELSCIDFIYPVGVKTYNSQNVLAQSFDLGTKKALYTFLSTVDHYDAAVLAYPLGLQTPDGSVQTIANNDTLETVVDAYTNECEALILPGGAELMDVIIDGSWRVTYFNNGNDLTANYAGYNFTFQEGGVVSVTSGEGTTTGSWNYGDSGGYKIVLLSTFIDSALSGLEQTWPVTNTTDTQINLYIPNTTIDPARYLQFTKN